MLTEKIIAEFLKIKSDGNLYHRESQYLEFKESFNLAGLADYFRDFAAFANNRGGYLIFGIKDRPKRELIGLTKKAIEQFDKLDPELITGYLLDIFSSNITWNHEIYKIQNFDVGVFYIYEAFIKPVITKKDEGKDQSLKNGEIYFRYGGRTQKIQYAELENIINKRIEDNNKNLLDLVEKIGKAGPQNAAVLNLEKGSIEKNDRKILVVDEDLIKQMSFIKEGEFNEKKGEKVLKLVGSIMPIDTVEVIKKVKENLLKEYPFSAQEIIKEIKKKIASIKEPQIYQAIKDNCIRGNKNYCAYNFRNKNHADKYYEHGILHAGTPCIFNQKAIDFLTQILTNELNRNVSK